MPNLDFSTERALLCSVLLGLDDFAQFLPNWQCFCQEQDAFPATGIVSVDSVGGLQKLDASNRNELGLLLHERDSREPHHCFWDCYKKEQGAAGTLALNVAKELKGTEKYYWTIRPWQLELSPKIYCLKWLSPFLLVLNQHVAGAILIREPSLEALPKCLIIFSSSDCCENSYECPLTIYSEWVLMIVRSNVGTPIRIEAHTFPRTRIRIKVSQISYSTRSPDTGIRKRVWWHLVSSLFPSGTLFSGPVGREIFLRSSKMRCHQAEWLLLFEELIPLFLRLLRFHLSKVRRPASSYIWRQGSKWNPISEKPGSSDILWAIVF